MNLEKMKSALLLFFIVALTNGFTIPIEEEETDNSLTPPKESKKLGGDMLKISKAPPARVAQPLGASIELECEVAGSPLPFVKWVHGSGQHLEELDSIEDNIISESDPAVITLVRSRLIINQQIEGERTFTCVGRSGPKTVYASTVVYKGSRALENDASNDVILPATNPFFGLKPIRITDYIKSLMANQGSNLVLPCKRIGHPKGIVMWLDPNQNLITGREARYKIFPTGELLISDLKWSDMGQFTCIAKNGFSEDKIETFIYPLRTDS